MADFNTEQCFLRLTLSPTIRRHQLRLPAIVTAPTDQTQQPCKNHLPTTMAAAETQQESFHRLTHSPTVLQHQLRLHPIKTRPSHPTPFHQPRGFVDELYEFPLPASPMISFTDSESKNYFHGFQDAPKAPPASSPTKPNQFPKATKPEAAACFEERFGNLPMPIRWRLMEACKSAMQELVDDVEKEMAACLNADLMLPEDVCLWKEVVATAEAVGLDVEEPKCKLATAIRLLSPA